MWYLVLKIASNTLFLLEQSSKSLLFSHMTILQNKAANSKYPITNSYVIV